MGNFFEHLEFFIHGADIFAYPHGLCIIYSVIILCLKGSVIGFGISVEIILSICDESWYLYSGYNQNNLWQWGKPCFWNSTTSKSDTKRNEKLMLVF